MKKALSFLVTALVLFSIASPAFAAWSATETFDTYSLGALNTLNGGSGWSAAWSASAGATVVSAPAGMSNQAAQITGANTPDAQRQFTSPTGLTEMTFLVRCSETNIDHRIGLQQKAVAERIQVFFTNAGQITANGTVIQAYNANQTYTVKLKWGHNGTNYAISIDGGAYSADIAITGGSTNIDNMYLDLNGSATGTFFVDSIGPVTVPAAPADDGGDWFFTFF